MGSSVSGNYRTVYESNKMKLLKKSLYDLNYAEFPFCYISKKRLTGLDRIYLQYEDTIKHLGERVYREFNIFCLKMKKTKELQRLNKIGNFTTDNIFLGFGGPKTLDIVYQLHQLWFEQGIENSFIDIQSYHSFMRRLGWQCSGRSYDQLKFQLSCLNNIRVEATSSLMQGYQKPLATKEFYLFPSLDHIEDQNSNNQLLKKQTIIGIDSGYFENIKRSALMVVPFNAEYFYSLKPLEKRLALYLSKIFNPCNKKYRSYTEWNRNLLQFSKQMPLISQNVKIIKKSFKRAFEGLIEKKYPFLECFEFNGENVRMICESPIEFENHIDVNKFVDQNNTLARLKKKPEHEIKNIIEDILEITNDKNSIGFYRKVANNVDNDLIYQALSEAKQEGSEPRKLFTYTIRKYLD